MNNFINKPIAKIPTLQLSDYRGFVKKMIPIQKINLN
jgi:hypothetical protein